MSCQKCGSLRIAAINNGKVTDLRSNTRDGRYHDGYVPEGFGNGIYRDFKFCLNCGQIQGSFPSLKTIVESGENEEA